MYLVTTLLLFSLLPIVTQVRGKSAPDAATYTGDTKLTSKQAVELQNSSSQSEIDQTSQQRLMEKLQHQLNLHQSDIETTTVSNSEQLVTRPSISQNDLENFRLEYNKYKILSHVGITANPDEMSPTANESIRSRLLLENQANIDMFKLNSGVSTAKGDGFQSSCFQHTFNQITRDMFSILI